MTDETPIFSVIIPTFNEERNIERTLKQTIEFFKSESNLTPYEILVVDDGSSDRTVSLLEQLIPSHGQIRLIKNAHFGKGNAVRTGVLSARGQYVLFTDADAATPIREVKRLLLRLTEDSFDVAVASREGTGARRYQEPYYRHLMGRAFNLIVQLLALPGIQDSQCGFKLFKAEAAKTIFNKLKIYGLDTKERVFAFTGAFDVEVLFLARKFGYRIKEVPVNWTYNRTNRVSPLRDSWLMFLDVIKIRINELKGVYR